MLQWLVIVVLLLLGIFFFQWGAQNAWLTATPNVDVDFHRTRAYIQFGLAAVAVCAAVAVYFFWPK